MHEITIQCPYCWEHGTILVEPGIDEQTMIEDCSVCCQPIQLRIQQEEGSVIAVESERAQ